MEALALFFQGLPFVVAALLGLLLALAARWTYANFGAGAGLIVVAFLQQTVLPGVGSFQIGINLYFMDFVTLLIIPVTLFRLLRLPEARVRSPALLALLAVVALNFISGVPTYGAGAGNAARDDVYSLVALTYASTFPAHDRRVATLVRALLWTAAVLFVITCVRWIAVAFQIDAMLPESGSFQPRGASEWRVIVSNEALVLAQVAVIGWFYSNSVAPLRHWRLLALPLVAAVIFLQHRSTWVAMLVAVAIAVTTLPRIPGAPRRWAVIGLLAFVLAVAAVIGGMGGGVSGDVEGSLDDAIALRGTAGERLGGWQQLIEKWSGDGPRSLALGHPYGVSGERYVEAGFGARKVTYQAHNYYVTLLTSLGLLGLGAYLALWWQVCSGLYRAARGKEGGAAAAALLTLLAAQAAYYLTYGTDTLQALILGTGLSYVGAMRRSALPSEAEPVDLERPTRPESGGAPG